MKLIRIPKTDLYVSSLCLGADYFGSTISNENSFNMLDAFYESGGNFVDSALIYADWLPGEKSISEKTLALWIKSRKLRNKIILSTKGAHPFWTSMDVPRLSPAEIISDLNKSLKNLQTDYIDIYWLHRDDPTRPVGEIIETLNDQVAEGKIRYFGCSNWKAHRIIEALAYSQLHGIDCFVANQMMWSLAEPNTDLIEDKTLVPMDSEGIKLHNDTQMAAIPYSSQAKGFFVKSAKIGFDSLKKGVSDVYYNVENVNRLNRAMEVAKNLSVSISGVVLAYLKCQPFTTIPVIGCKTIEQLTDTLQYSDLELDNSILKFIETGI